jgi:hypothetical protein
MEAVKDVTAEAAAAHPISGAHSIWELVLHLGGTYRLVLRRLGDDQGPAEEDGQWTFPMTCVSSWPQAGS